MSYLPCLLRRVAIVIQKPAVTGDYKELWPQTVKVTVAPTKMRVVKKKKHCGYSHMGKSRQNAYFRTVYWKSRGETNSIRPNVAEPESDTDLVQPGPSTPTPHRPHVDPLGDSRVICGNTLMKIVKSEHSKGKHPSRQCRVCAVHKKRSMTVYICKFCVMPLHKGNVSRNITLSSTSRSTGKCSP
jgi:hypothetical protein